MVNIRTFQPQIPNSGNLVLNNLIQGQQIANQAYSNLLTPQRYFSAFNNGGYSPYSGYNQGYNPYGGYNSGFNNGYYNPQGGYYGGYNNGYYNYNPYGGYSSAFNNPYSGGYNAGFNQGYNPYGGFNSGFNQGYNPYGGFNSGFNQGFPGRFTSIQATNPYDFYIPGDPRTDLVLANNGINPQFARNYPQIYSRLSTLLNSGSSGSPSYSYSLTPNQYQFSSPTSNAAYRIILQL